MNKCQKYLCCSLVITSQLITMQQQTAILNTHYTRLNYGPIMYSGMPARKNLLLLPITAALLIASGIFIRCASFIHTKVSLPPTVENSYLFIKNLLPTSIDPNLQWLCFGAGVMLFINYVKELNNLEHDLQLLQERVQQAERILNACSNEETAIKDLLSSIQNIQALAEQSQDESLKQGAQNCQSRLEQHRKSLKGLLAEILPQPSSHLTIPSSQAHRRKSVPNILNPHENDCDHA